jgi:hypothetical protein
MYETPLLVTYGSFRELTMQGIAKQPLINDLASVNGQGQNDGCNVNPDSPNPASCISA